MPDPFTEPKFHNNPAPFRATGQGWQNRVPNLVASKHNANGKLTLLGSPESIPNGHIYLFVTDVETGWTLSGDYGQSKAHRTFYPQNIHQDEMVIQGVCANQFEYDRIVEFVSNHHHKVVQDSRRVVEFKLFPYRISMNSDKISGPFRYVTRPIFVEAVINGIEAGHERFKNAPTFNISLKVTDDKLQQGKPHTESEIDAMLKKKYETIFGASFKSPVVREGTDLPESETTSFDDRTESTFWEAITALPSWTNGSK